MYDLNDKNDNLYDTIRMDLWPQMSLEQLWGQRILIETKLNTVLSMRKGEMARQIQMHLKNLDTIIEEKGIKEKPLTGSIILT